MVGVVETRTGRLWVDDALGCIVFEGRAGSEQTRQDAIENISALDALRRQGSYPLLCDITAVKWIGTDATMYYNGAVAVRAYRAVALVAASKLSAMIGNVFLHLRAPGSTPARMFTSRAEAVAWLRRVLAEGKTGWPA